MNPPAMLRAAIVSLALAAPCALSAQPQLCVELPPPHATETVAISLGAARALPGADGSWSQNDAEQAALRTVVERLRAIVPVPPPPRAPNTSMRFALLDSAAGLFVADITTSHEFTLHADGRIGDVARMHSSVEPGADSMMTGVLARLAGTETLAGVSRAFGADSVRLRMFTTISRPGTERPVTWIEAPFYERPLPVFRGTQVAMIPPAVGPRYPANAGRREDGEAFASFIVRANGTIDPGSITIANATAPEFGDALQAWLPSVRFTPATIEGCPMRAAAGFPMKFSVRGGV